MSSLAATCHLDPKCLGSLFPTIAVDLDAKGKKALLEKGLLGAALGASAGVTDSALMLRATRIDGVAHPGIGFDDDVDEEIYRLTTHHELDAATAKQSRVRVEQELELVGVGEGVSVDELVYGAKPEPYREPGPAFAIEGSYEVASERRVERHLMHQVGLYGGGTANVASRTENVEVTVLPNRRVRVAFDAVFERHVPREVSIVHELRVSERDAYEVFCTGGGDEDADGAVDCDDSDCAEHPACAGGGSDAAPDDPDARGASGPAGCAIDAQNEGDAILSTALLGLFVFGASRLRRRGGGPRPQV